MLGAPTGLDAETEPQTIIGGQEVDACAWPSAARVLRDAYALGAVLIHPRVVALNSVLLSVAPDVDTFSFDFGYPRGEPGALTIETPISNCHFDGEFGVCVLDEPATLAYAPPLVGCEEAQLIEGADVTIVGFGYIGEDFNIFKRAAPMTVRWTEDLLLELEGEAGPCAGDMGSPAFLRLNDGSWRTVGIARDGACGDGSTNYLALASRVPWIEEVTGFDLTPCHDALGLPDPGAECGGFFSGDETDHGAWPSNYCGAGPVGGDGGVCSGDVDPPSAEITTPNTDATYPDVPSTVLVEIEATDGNGLGVRDVRLSIDGQLLPNERTEAPYTFEVDLPEGLWTLTASARDWAGNVGMSEKVTVIVGDPPLPPSGTTGDPGETDGADGGSTSGIPSDETGSATPESTSDTDAEATSSSTGGCSVTSRGHEWLASLLGVVLFLRRRRMHSARQA